MPQEITILDKPQLPQSSDYAYLRSKGLEYIEKLGSRLWTDYNIHDPGITLLELLSYAISDLGYRTSLDTKDLLTDAPGSITRQGTQTFFTARDIMTMSPLTQNDYRKMLIDIDGIKNGWLQCKSCGCDRDPITGKYYYLYADCKTSKLQYEETEHPVTLKGMYDVLVEFEDEEGVGDLNNGKIKYNFPFKAGTKLTNAVIELRLPSWHDIDAAGDNFKYFRLEDTTITNVKVKSISANKGDNANISYQDLGSALRLPLFVTLDVEMEVPDQPGTQTMSLEDVPATLWFRNDDERKAIQVEDIKDAIEARINDTVISESGIIPRYAERVRKADSIIGLVHDALNANRNLCEDFCSVKAIQTEEIAMCADIDVTPDADIEKVMAQAYYLADQYMSQDIKFYSLKELLDAGRTTDDIFDGPALNNGFIDNEQMERTQLKTELHTSDIINMIMDIPGVAAVRNFTLVKYDKEGYRTEAQSWSMNISPDHQPRLYVEASKLVAYKNGLPFLPDKMELADTLQIVKGRNIQPKYSLADLDTAIPAGTYYPLTDYYPLQYSLPVTYGVGEAGLPATATQVRKNQAKQLKAYLLFFEQMLVNYLEQLNHLKDFFSLSNNIGNSYFTRVLTDSDIAGVTEFYNVAGDDPSEKVENLQKVLNNLAEDESTFLNRRNRFLDNLLARFAEQFTDYTLMLYSYSASKKQADEMLVNNKIAFLKDYPFISRNRARSFNNKDADHICTTENVSGLQRRISRLLGFGGIANYITFVPENDDDNQYRWQLEDNSGKVLLRSGVVYNGSKSEMYDSLPVLLGNIVPVISELSNYGYTEISVAQFEVKAYGSGEGTSVASIKTAADAEDFINYIVDFVTGVLESERVYVVEHLLLRPRNWRSFDAPVADAQEILLNQEQPDLLAGQLKAAPPKKGYTLVKMPPDMLLPICIPPDCNTCGEEDPYSFRLSVFMNGEAGIAGTNMEYRKFAEDTIRMETPAHLSLKICWLRTNDLISFGEAYCDWQQKIADNASRADIHTALSNLLTVMAGLKNYYPPARLHDCSEGSEDSRVFLNHTVI